jgi:hypothetical protein
VFVSAFERYEVNLENFERHIPQMLPTILITTAEIRQLFTACISPANERATNQNHYGRQKAPDKHSVAKKANQRDEATHFILTSEPNRRSDPCGESEDSHK